ncbi:tetratricopeptide repeat protein [Trichuris suis]|nr:tetratricopeptide repeat protein [Trichuris suis]
MVWFQVRSDDRMKKVALFLLAFISYWNALFGGFVYDDIEAIVKNSDVRWPPLTRSATGKRQFWQFLFNDFWGMPMHSMRSHKSWRPLTVLSFRLNYMLNELQPLHYHSVNVLLHGIVTVLSLDFYTAMQPPPEPKKHLVNLPFWSSLLFACHPVHVDAAFCIAYEVLLYSWHPLTCNWKSDTDLRRCVKGCGSLSHNNRLVAIKRMGTLLVAFIVIAIFRLHLMAWTLPHFSNGDCQELPAFNFAFRVANRMYIYLLNLWILFCPSFLCFDYSMGCIEPIQSFKDFRLWLIVFGTGILALLAWVQKRRRSFENGINSRHRAFHGLFHYEKLTFALRHLLLGLSGVVIPFVPASNVFFTVGFVLAERVLYLPSLGFCWIAAYFILRVKASMRHGSVKNLFTGLFCFTLAAFTCRCILRNNQWLNEWTLFTSGLSVCPNNAKIHYNLGKLNAKAGRRDEAFKYYEKAIALNGDYDFALNNLAVLFLNARQYANAEKLLQRAVAANHEFAVAWMNLGTVQTKLKKYREAEMSYKIAIRYQPNCADCFYNMGNMYNSNNDSGNAVALWLKAIKTNQHHAEAWINLIIAARNWRTIKIALKIGFLALKVLPTHDKIHYAIANCYALWGDHHRSRIHFIAAIRSNPTVKKYHTSLGHLQRSWRNEGLQPKKRQSGLFPQLHLQTDTFR